MTNRLPSPLEVVLLASVLRTWTAAGQTMCRTERALPDQALVGHVFKTITRNEMMGCVAACEMDASCYSINYHKDSSTCELNGRSARWVPGAVQPRAQSVYLSMAIRRYDPCTEQRVSCAGKCVSQPGSLETWCICYGRQNQTCGNMTCVPGTLGMEQGIITNEQLQASSTHAQSQLANARLRHVEGAWTPRTDHTAQWFQVNFAPRVKLLTGVATQGDGRNWWYVTSYVVKYKLADGQLESYMAGNSTKVFQGNENKDDIVINSFSSPFTTDAFRICPRSYFGRIALRMELYGCSIA